MDFLRPEIPWPDVRQILMAGLQVANSARRDHFWEVYCPPRVGPILRERGYRSFRSIDLKASWDLSMDEVRRQVFVDLIELRPFFVLLCPPCTYFSNLMFSNWGKMKGEDKYEKLKMAVQSLDFCMLIAEFQKQTGSYYVFEHKESAASWKRASAEALILFCSLQ